MDGRVQARTVVLYHEQIWLKDAATDGGAEQIWLELHKQNGAHRDLAEERKSGAMVLQGGGYSEQICWTGDSGSDVTPYKMGFGTIFQK